MRSLPDNKSKNQTVALIYWFYTEIMGKKPDASLYARHMNRKNPKALIHLLAPESDVVASYTATELGELVYYLIDNGINVTDISIVTISGLAYNYVSRKQNGSFQAELDRTVEWLRKTKSSDTSTNDEMYNKFNGWGG